MGSLGEEDRRHPERTDPERIGREDTVAKEDRGFASMDRARQRDIASKGGKAAHQKGTAHEWTSDEARDAGRKGGIASHRRRREQMGEAGPEEGAAPVVPPEPGTPETGGSDQGGGFNPGGF